MDGKKRVLFGCNHRANWDPSVRARQVGLSFTDLSILYSFACWFPSKGELAVSRTAGALTSIETRDQLSAARTVVQLGPWLK